MNGENLATALFVGSRVCESQIQSVSETTFESSSRRLLAGRLQPGVRVPLLCRVLFDAGSPEMPASIPTASPFVPAISEKRNP